MRNRRKNGAQQPRACRQGAEPGEDRRDLVGARRVAFQVLIVVAPDPAVGRLVFEGSVGRHEDRCHQAQRMSR
jgi:hypothetical protein